MAEAANSFISDSESPWDVSSNTASGGGSALQGAYSSDRDRPFLLGPLDSDDDDLLSNEAFAQCKDDIDSAPCVASPFLEESETPLAPNYVPRPVPWQRAWTLLVSEV